MKIAVNTRLLLKDKLEGIGWFSFETLKRICIQHPEIEFFFIFDRKYDPDFIFSPNITPVVIGPQARHPFLFYLWFNFSLHKVLKKLNPDLFLSPDGYNCLPWKGKSLIVLHDLNFETRPKDVPWLIRKYYRHYFPKFAAKATRIATVSEFSKSDIVKHYHIKPEKIDVVYNGVNEKFKPLDQESIHKTRLKYAKGFPYFLFVGALHPRKNIDNLLLAFDTFKISDNENHKLVIAGARKWWTNEIRSAYESMRFKNDVYFTGRVDEHTLHNLVGAALALTYVSHFEGFGIPLVEAFSCGTPVITSNVTSMPEVAGDAALFADPASPDKIAEAIQKMATNRSLRNDLITKGFKRKDDFSWQKSANLLWDSIMITLTK